jgi:hypothetical protein
MVTTRNSHKDSVNSNAEANLLLDRLRLILSITRHLTSACGDMLKYVHEKPACCDICEKGAGAELASYKTFEAKLMANTEITERRQSTCLLKP